MAVNSWQQMVRNTIWSITLPTYMWKHIVCCPRYTKCLVHFRLLRGIREFTCLYSVTSLSGAVRLVVCDCCVHTWQKSHCTIMGSVPGFKLKTKYSSIYVKVASVALPLLSFLPWSPFPSLTSFPNALCLIRFADYGTWMPEAAEWTLLRHR